MACSFAESDLDVILSEAKDLVSQARCLRTPDRDYPQLCSHAVMDTGSFASLRMTSEIGWFESASSEGSPMRSYYTYILASKSRTLYIGVTADLERRMREHITKSYPKCFTAKYNINRLVWFERFQFIKQAIEAEKKLKGWIRKKKTDLIEHSNPHWDDLSANWGALGDLRWSPDRDAQKSDLSRSPINLGSWPLAPWTPGLSLCSG